MNKITDETLLEQKELLNTLELNSKSGEDKIKYVCDILGSEDNVIYCKVAKKPSGGKIILDLYNLKNGMRTDIVKDPKGSGWKFIVEEKSKSKNLKEGDFIRANIKTNKGGQLCVENIEKLDSFDEFKEKLVALLKPKWRRKGFTFQPHEIIRYDGDTAFNEWVLDRVETMLEEKYQIFIEDKMKKNEEKLDEQKREFDNLIQKQTQVQKELVSIKIERDQIQKERDAIKTERDQIQKECDAIETEQDQMQKALYDIMGKKYREQIVLDKLIDKQKKRQKWAKKKQKELDDILNELKQAKEKRELEFDDPIDIQKGEQEKQYYKYSTFENLIDEVWTYIRQEKNLYYEKSIIKYFMNALRTKQLIILWGKPGTGKTSLPRAVAHAIHAKFIRVQVQSNWTDNQDLLGFYNIVDKRYISTQFMDALIDASKNTEQMYIILLDEMNLSKIEYYFSEMLNVFTWDEPYKLHLYSEHLKKNARKDLMLAKSEKDNSRINAVNAVLDDMKIYKPEFTVPENVRFVGTINVDETTKTISPKVIDRSCLIELNTISNRKKYDKKDIMLDGKKMVEFENFAIKQANDTEKGQNNKIKENIKELFDKTKTVLTISNRLDFYIDQWTSQNDNCVTLDEIVLEKILPVIDIEDNEGNTKTLQELQKSLTNDKYKCIKSADKLKSMLENKQKYIKKIRYWEN